MARMYVSGKEFVMAWQEANSAKEVADKFGLQIATVQQRAKQYRKHGIELKVFDKSSASRGKRLDIEELQKLCSTPQQQEDEVVLTKE